MEIELTKDQILSGDFEKGKRYVYEGDLDLSDTQTTKLPDNLRVGGDLVIKWIPIASLPEKLSVGGSLELWGTQISKLPDNLRVGRDLKLSLTQIKELSEKLSVGGDLHLWNTQITKLPDSSRVKGAVYWEIG